MGATCATTTLLSYAVIWGSSFKISPATICLPLIMWGSAKLPRLTTNSGLLALRRKLEQANSSKSCPEVSIRFWAKLSTRASTCPAANGSTWISRAFMSDAAIVIMDEPTAALDAFREYRLYEQVTKFTKGKTVVFISHRFSTVRMADDIIVMEGGNAVETGSHDELMAKNGRYAAMFATQAARYS